MRPQFEDVFRCAKGDASAASPSTTAVTATVCCLAATEFELARSQEVGMSVFLYTKGQKEGLGFRMIHPIHVPTSPPQV